MSTATMMSSFALALVARYPRAWKERYADEVVELLEAAPVRLNDVLELWRGLIVERVRVLLEDTEHPKRTAAVLGLMSTGFVLLFVFAAIATGLALRAWSPPSPLVPNAGAVAVIAVALGLLAGLWATWRRRSRIGHGTGLIDPVPRLPVTFVLLLPIHFAAIVLFLWGDVLSAMATPAPRPILFLCHLQMWLMITAQLASGLWPRRQLLLALGRLRWTEQALTGAHKWVENCREWIDKGVPSPLNEAQAQVTELQDQRTEDVERLRRLGYRARFDR